MAYGHAWYRPKILKSIPYQVLSDDVHRLIMHLPAYSTSAGRYYDDIPLIVRGGNGVGVPRMTQDDIFFNGDEATEMDHGSFHFPRIMKLQSWDEPHPEHKNMYYDWCNTDRKPYDLVVSTTLICIKANFPEIVISSDATPSEWVSALIWYHGCFPSRELPEGPWRIA